MQTQLGLEDFNVIQRMDSDLQNPNSSISIFLQDLAIFREAYLDKVKRIRKEDNIFKLVGIVEGIDLAIKRAYQIVELYKDEMDKKRKETQGAELNSVSSY